MKTLNDSLFLKPIGILGGGISGQAVSKFVTALGSESVVYDETSGRGKKTVLTPNDASNHNLIINSPGFPPHHPWFKIAKDAGCQVMSEIEFSSYFWKGPIFFVTGTNGKSTITQLLTAVLIEAGHDAYAFGNIGIPFSEHYNFNPKDNSIAVVELSSFQAWNLKEMRADGIIWTNFAEDHLDWHGSMERYFNAKWKAVLQVASGPVVFGSDVAGAANKFGVPTPEHANVFDTEAFDSNEAQPISRINQINVEFVKRFVLNLNIDQSLVDDVASRFAFLPHRMEYVGEASGIHFWNDSKATNFHAVEAALDNFYEPVIWLGGGLDKGGDIESFAASISNRIRFAVTFGAISERLTDALLANGVMTFEVDTLEEALKHVKIEAYPGDEVVLSPGFASFDQFNGYADRGRIYKSLVTEKFFTQTKYPIQINN